MKGYYYLAQAQLALKHPNEAVSSAITAYRICLETKSSSTASVAALVLQAKKLKWEAKERARLRERSDLFRELEDSLVRSEALDIDQAGDSEEVDEIQTATRGKIEELRNIFAIADPVNMQRRVRNLILPAECTDGVQELPDYMIDNITFQFMHDPVVTKSGQSYERSTIETHLRTSHTDPLTREMLHIEDLRPNLALKQACAEFLEGNGWAVDW